MEQVIKSHNSKITNSNHREEQRGGCNCQRRYKESCSIENNCNQKNVIYQATVENSNGERETYVGLAENFKKMHYKHKASMERKNPDNTTTLVVGKRGFWANSTPSFHEGVLL